MTRWTPVICIRRGCDSARRHFVMRTRERYSFFIPPCRVLFFFTFFRLSGSLHHIFLWISVSFSPRAGYISLSCFSLHFTVFLDFCISPFCEFMNLFSSCMLYFLHSLVFFALFASSALYFFLHSPVFFTFRLSGFLYHSFFWICLFSPRVCYIPSFVHPFSLPFSSSLALHITHFFYLCLFLYMSYILLHSLVFFTFFLSFWLYASIVFALFLLHFILLSSSLAPFSAVSVWRTRIRWAVFGGIGCASR